MDNVEEEIRVEKMHNMEKKHSIEILGSEFNEIHNKHTSFKDNSKKHLEDLEGKYHNELHTKEQLEADFAELKEKFDKLELANNQMRATIEEEQMFPTKEGEERERAEEMAEIKKDVDLLSQKI